MKTYQFTSPEGKQYTIDGPDSATPEQAMAVLQKHLAPKPEPTFGEEAVQSAQDFGVGMASGAARIGRSMFSSPPSMKNVSPSPEWVDRSKNAWEGVMKGNTLQGEPTDRTNRGVSGAAGELTAELAGTAGVPGGALTRGLRYLPNAARAVAEGAGAGALTGEGEGIGLGAAGGLAGQKLTQGVGTLLRGARGNQITNNEMRRLLYAAAAGVGAQQYFGWPWSGGNTPGIAAAAYLGLGTRTGQRMLEGRLRSQRALADFMRSHPTAGSTTGAVMAENLGD